MKLNEFYVAVDGNYEDAMARRACRMRCSWGNSCGCCPVTAA